jgi:hypothetical protein
MPASADDSDLGFDADLALSQRLSRRWLAVDPRNEEPSGGLVTSPA